MSLSFVVCVSLLQAKIVNPPLMATASHHPLNVTTHNQPLNQSTHSRNPQHNPQQSTTTNHQINQPTPTTQSHRINPNPQIKLAPTDQSTPWNQPNIYKSTQHPQINLHHEINPHPQPTNLNQLGKTQPHLECLVSSVALAVKATLREHIYDTFVSIYLIGITLIK